MANHLSFAAQALRYFDRPHESIARRPLDSRRGLARLGGGATQRLDDAAHGRRGRRAGEGCRRGRSAAGSESTNVRREDFPLPSARAARSLPGRASWRAAAASCSSRGLPVERWGDERSALVYWGIGQHLGEPGAQNPQGELLGHVIDYRRGRGQPVRAPLSHGR